jgi:EF-P beta-lysylation protein EpmB
MNARTSLSWQKKLAQGFTTASELLEFLELPAIGSELAEKQFPSRIPLGFAQRMQKGNPNDPLLLQILAVDKELEEVAGYESDPLEEARVNPLQGMIHKYHGRVLLTLTGACAVNCRYCFRRHFPYRANNPGRQGWEAIYEYLVQDNTISEVILSGGEPLLASTSVLREVFAHIEEIPHVHTVRIHTRIPIVFPERIDKELLDLFEASRLTKVIVAHCNHPQEIDSAVGLCCRALQQAGCVLLNQSVMLRGVNDDADILVQLSHSLFTYGVMPYYLHVLDKVQGAAHFDLPFAQVQSIFKQLQTRLPGYLVPRLVREEPGKRSKTLLI